jgi:hypothetical protein
MTDPITLRAVVDAQLGASAPKVRELLDRLVSDEATPNFGELTAAPGAMYLGDLRAAVERVVYDPVARHDAAFTSTMLSAALVEIIISLAGRVEDLEARLEASVEGKPTSGAKGGAKAKAKPKPVKVKAAK